jgi:hypothetical protein
VRVPCTITQIDLDGDYEDAEGFPVRVDSVCATCERCGNETESYGTSAASVRRCLVLMREECPEGENNFYVADGADDDE